MQKTVRYFTETGIKEIKLGGATIHSLKHALRNNVPEFKTGNYDAIIDGEVIRRNIGTLPENAIVTFVPTVEGNFLGISAAAWETIGLVIGVAGAVCLMQLRLL